MINVVFLSNLNCSNFGVRFKAIHQTNQNCISYTMCTSFQNLRQRLRLERAGNGVRIDGSGDGDVLDSSSLLQEMGVRGVLTFQYPLLIRIAIASIFLIVVLLLSHKLAWAAFVFDVVKPIYFVYIAGIATVDLLRPVIRKLDGWLVDYPPTQSPLDLRRNVPSDPEVLTTTNAGEEEAENHGASQSDCSTPPPSPVPEYEDATNNNKLLTDQISATTYNSANTKAAAVRTPSKTSSSKRTWIPAPLNKNRKVKSRGRSAQGETNAQLLRALESELRKETELPEKGSSDNNNNNNRKKK